MQRLRPAGSFFGGHVAAVLGGGTALHIRPASHLLPLPAEPPPGGRLRARCHPPHLGKRLGTYAAVSIGSTVGVIHNRKNPFTRSVARSRAQPAAETGRGAAAAGRLPAGCERAVRMRRRAAGRNRRAPRRLLRGRAASAPARAHAGGAEGGGAAAAGSNFPSLGSTKARTRG